MKPKLIITISNDFVYDQRMQRISRSLSENFRVEILAVAKSRVAYQDDYGFPITRLSIPFRSGILFYMFLNIQMFFKLTFVKSDVIYSVDLDTILAGRLASLLRNRMQVFDAHEYFSEVPELKDQQVKKSIWEWVARRCVPYCSVCITVNELLAQKFEKLYNNEFISIRNVPWLQSQSLAANQVHKADSDKRIILYQGVLNKGRGIELMIQAMKSLPDYQLILAGGGDLMNELQLLKERESVENVEFMGYMTPEKLKSLTQQAYIGLNLIDADSLNYYYSLANKFFDYVQAGVPSINMAFPAYEKLNQDFEVSVLIDSLAVINIVEAVKALENEAHYSRLQQNCVEAAKVWNWDLEKEKLGIILQKYQELNSHL